MIDPNAEPKASTCAADNLFDLSQAWRKQPWLIQTPGGCLRRCRTPHGTFLPACMLRDRHAHVLGLKSSSAPPNRLGPLVHWQCIEESTTFEEHRVCFFYNVLLWRANLYYVANGG